MNIEDIKQANAEAGQHFFSRSTLRFFDSRIGQSVSGVWHGSHTTGDRRPGGQYFITSERRSWNEPRLYTVRRFNPVTRSIDTIGEFNVLSRNGALALAKRARAAEQATGEWQGRPEPADRNTRVDGGRLPKRESRAAR